MNHDMANPPAPSPCDMSHHWAVRGYRPPAEQDKGIKIDDETGEEAYQRCFAEASKMDPPRVPNPAFFKNSASAKEYIQRKDRELFARREADAERESDTRKRNPNFVPHAKDLHSVARSSPSSADSLERPHLLPDGMVGPAREGMMATAATVNRTSQNHTPSPQPTGPSQGFASPSRFEGQLPMTMEPQFGPTGPGRMLR